MITGPRNSRGLNEIKTMVNRAGRSNHEAIHSTTKSNPSETIDGVFTGPTKWSTEYITAHLMRSS
ncbi:hypothetical protein Poly59_02800 [Rubripirellula reticaptiva]|uniref:Uncharacterized protein n=1 Tax=Rubripirellula reticaptiva TaxID=2528013 RepID=A0A5C6F6P7_9BACT|nr:hypothetical protein Poly59_02800 [Rubripirellula reticaptiva]